MAANSYQNESEKDLTTIEGDKTYSINSQRIKDRARARKITMAKLSKLASLSEVSSLYRNLRERYMKGATLLDISKALDCTPYYFLEPSVMFFDEPLQYWHYEYQQVGVDKSFRNFFLARNLCPDDINRISREDRDAFEAFAQTIIDKYKSDRG